MPRMTSQETRDRWAVKLYGCNEADAIRLNSGQALRFPSGAAYQYATQRQAAKVRGVEWKFTLEEWLAVWIESGHWALRGVGIGRYCMARRGDAGPYSKDNVFIQASTANSRDGLATRHAKAAASGASV